MWLTTPQSAYSTSTWKTQVLVNWHGHGWGEKCGEKWILYLAMTRFLEEVWRGLRVGWLYPWADRGDHYRPSLHYSYWNSRHSWCIKQMSGCQYASNTARKLAFKLNLTFQSLQYRLTLPQRFSFKFKFYNSYHASRSSTLGSFLQAWMECVLQRQYFFPEPN